MSIFEKYSLKQLANLDLLAKQVVEGFIIGLHKSPYHGFSVEFAEHRIYNPGESTKSIDWKVYARTNKLFTKKYEEETNLRCQLVIDTSSSMYFPEMDLEGKSTINKLGFSALAAAALMNLLQKQRDAFGLSLFEDTLHTHTRTKSSTSHYKLLLTHLEKTIDTPKLGKDTKASVVLHEIAERLHRRSMVIIFSDMFEHEEMDVIFDSLLHLKHNKHEVVLFHVVDKNLEIDFEYENRPHIFEDMETGEKIKLNPAQVKESYIKKITEFNKQIRINCLQYQIDFVEANIHEGFNPILNKFLLKRSKMNA